MTVVIAIAAFLPLIAVLVIVHEMGHFLTARRFGVKVMEFGLGYPPRLFGIRTGRTRISLNELTRYKGVSGKDDLKVGGLVKLGVVEAEDGALVARTVEVPRGEATESRGSDQAHPARQDDLKLEGTVRQIQGDGLVVADMLYSVNLLPLGGFVRLAGENNPRVPRSLSSKGVGPRFIVLSAGAFMNAVLAIAVFSALFMTPQDVVVGDVSVDVVRAGSPAEAAGVLPGDVITRAAGRKIENRGDLSTAVGLNLGSQMEWQIVRDSKPASVHVTPRWNPPEGEGATGIEIGLTNRTTVSRSDLPWTAVGRAFTTIGDMLVLTKNEVSSWFRGKDPELAGPVGIAQITGEVAEQGDIRILLAFAAFLSMNLAILNILPIPMLDGGRLVFVVIEWVRRGKRVSPEKEALVHLIGFVLLIGLVVIISYGDISRIVSGDSLLR